jgi:hemerythrin superfamily protein
MARTKKTQDKDAIALLKEDHQKVRGLLSELEETTERASDKREKLLATIEQELKIHTKIEEEIFYPEVRAAGEQLDETVAEGIEEHHVVDVLIDEVRQLTPGDEAWVAKMTVMMENVEHHASEEEDEMFPDVRGVLDEAALADQARRLEARKAELGAPTVADEEHLTVDELAELARAQEIPGRSTMDRDELLATVAPAS